MKLKAFTLSELLIAMAVIGVIAVLTVPSITRNVFNNSNIVKLQATIRDLDTAVKNMMVNEHVNTPEDGSLYYDVDEFLDKYLKITVNCSALSRTCLPTTTKTIETPSGGMLPIARVCAGASQQSFIAMLPSGAVVEFCPSGKIKSDSAVGFFVIDVNGTEPPNVLGRDYFAVELLEDGSVGFDASSGYEATLDSCRMSQANMGYDCYILLESNNWKINY